MKGFFKVVQQTVQKPTFMIIFFFFEEVFQESIDNVYNRNVLRKT